MEATGAVEDDGTATDESKSSRMSTSAIPEHYRRDHPDHPVLVESPLQK
jgi:hypothetical protein